jgi:hypothetical protein
MNELILLFDSQLKYEIIAKEAYLRELFLDEQDIKQVFESLRVFGPQSAVLRRLES